MISKANSEGKKEQEENKTKKYITGNGLGKIICCRVITIAYCS
jgi:hypothetical protein